MNAKVFAIAQLALAGLIAVFAISILGTAGHTLSVFNAQRDANAWWIPLWSDHFNVSGPKALISSASTTLILYASFIVVNSLPRFNLKEKPHLRVALAFAIGIPAAIIELATLIYAHLLNRAAPDIDTIQTWTCRYKDDNSNAIGATVPQDQSNQNFSQVCSESSFAIYGSLIVFLLQSLVIGIAAIGWVADIVAKRKERKRWKNNGEPEKYDVAY